MSSEYRRREQDPSRRPSPEDQEKLELLAFHASRIMGALREGTPWIRIYGHLVQLRPLLRWAYQETQLDPRTIVQADGRSVGAEVEDKLTEAGYFEEAPDHLPPEWGDPKG